MEKKIEIGGTYLNENGSKYVCIGIEHRKNENVAIMIQPSSKWVCGVHDVHMNDDGTIYWSHSDQIGFNEDHVECKSGHGGKPYDGSFNESALEYLGW